MGPDRVVQVQTLFRSLGSNNPLTPEWVNPHAFSFFLLHLLMAIDQRVDKVFGGQSAIEQPQALCDLVRQRFIKRGHGVYCRLGEAP